MPPDILLSLWNGGLFQNAPVCALALSFLSCVTSGQFLNLSEPPWPQQSLRECYLPALQGTAL